MLANIALPSFLPHSFATLAGIFVIAAIEGWFVMRSLRLSYAESYRHTLKANWNSTVVGIPLAWLFWVAGLIPVSMGLSAVGVEAHPAVSSTAMHTAFFGGVIPTEWEDVGKAVAWIVMLIPFWMGSVWIERRTFEKSLPNCSSSQISTAVVRANLASYSLFLMVGVVGLCSALSDLPNQKQKFERLEERQKAAAEVTGESP